MKSATQIQSMKLCCWNPCLTRRRLALQRRRLRHVPLLVVGILLGRGEMSEGPGIYTHTLYCFSASCRDSPAPTPSSIVTTAHASRQVSVHSLKPALARAHHGTRPATPIHVLPSRLRVFLFPHFGLGPHHSALSSTTSISVSSLLTICGDSVPRETVDRWPNSDHWFFF